MRSWTSRSTGARRRGRTRHPVGHSSAPTRGPPPARRIGHRCRPGRRGAPSPSGRASKRDAPTTSGGPGTERRAEGARTFHGGAAEGGHEGSGIEARQEGLWLCLSVRTLPVQVSDLTPAWLSEVLDLDVVEVTVLDHASATN